MNNKFEKSGDSLGRCFVRIGRANWHRRCISDSTGRNLTYGRTLITAFAMAEKISKLTAVRDKVGIMLPPSVPAVLTNLAVTLAGKITVNLNYTASVEARKYAANECGLRCVISSRKFLNKAGIDEHDDKFVFIEDLIADIGFVQMIRAYIKARFAGIKRVTANEIATIIFSSGTSGVPKGVMLTHSNILSNITAILKVVKINGDDNLCGVLPFFHSFGFTCGLWLPLIAGASAAYVPKGLDAAEVGRQAHKNRSTILFTPPTFLSNYAKKTEKDDFATLRLVFAGAEKLRTQLADDFEVKFGVRPLEGYGTTELSPVVSLNLPEQNKEGTVGKALPGISVKIVDEQKGQRLKPGATGLIMIKGPNVMVGYLNMQKETYEVLKDGWYNTGDIGYLDDDGFLTVTDRLSRFSKIAGEMVPHAAVEQAYLKGLEIYEQAVAVTGIPNAKRGEELIVLYLPEAGPAERLHEIIIKSKLPNIYKPKRRNYIKINSMPTLGSGKLDIMKLRKIALAKLKHN